jgi:hypothetical protein
MYLELAEGENNGNYQALAEAPGAGYVFVPGGFLPEFSADTYVRADYFATNYDPETATQIVNALASQQTVGLSVLPIAAAAGALNLAKNLIAKRQAAVAAGTAKPIFKPGGLFDKIKGGIVKLKGGAAAAPAAAPAPVETTPAPVTRDFPAVSFDINQPQPTFWQRNKTPILVGAGALAVVGTILLVTRKKRR